MSGFQHPLVPTAGPFAAVLQEVAVAVSRAQAALDESARMRVGEAEDQPRLPPPLAFYFPEVTLDLSVAFALRRGEVSAELWLTPANPVSIGFFGAVGFQSRLRARIAPLAVATMTAPEGGAGDDR